MGRLYKLNNGGMSLIEIMVVVGIVGLVGLGSTAMIRNMSTQQKRAYVKADLHRLRDHFISTLKNSEAWLATVNHANNNGKLSCLRAANLNCSTTPVATPIENIEIRDINDVLFFRAQQATRGFTLDGEACNTFNAAGNDDCPVRYNLQVFLRCPGNRDPCAKPRITIVGLFQYAPTDRSDLRTRILTTPYNFTVELGDPQIYEPFEVQFANNGNGGTCQAGWFNAGINTEVYDVGDNVALVAGNRFSLQRGRYICDVMAKAYNQNGGTGFQVRLSNVDGGGDHIIGKGRSLTETVPGSPNVLGSEVFGHADFDVNTNGERFELQYNCSNTSAGHDTGRSVGGAPTNIHRSVSCVKVR